MNNSLIISQIFGPLFIILGISMMINTSWYQKIFKKIQKAHVSIFVLSIFSFVFGMFIINTYAGFGDIHQGLASFVGLAMVFKSTLYLLQPTLMQRLTKTFEPVFANIHYLGTLYLLFGIFVSYIAYI